MMRPLVLVTCWRRYLPTFLGGRTDGLIRTGGGDVDPATYGAASGGVAGEDPGADSFEIGLLHAAQAGRLPTVAMCRDAQLPAVARGGRRAQQPVATDSHRTLPGKDEPEQRVPFAELVADARGQPDVPTLAAAGPGPA